MANEEKVREVFEHLRKHGDLKTVPKEERNKGDIFLKIVRDETHHYLVRKQYHYSEGDRHFKALTPKEYREAEGIVAAAVKNYLDHLSDRGK